MTYYWHNGHRIKTRGKDSMMAEVGSVDQEVLDPTIGPVKHNKEKTKPKGVPVSKTRRRSGVACVDDRHNKIGLRKDLPESAFRNNRILFFDEIGKGFDWDGDLDGIQVVLEDLDRTLSSLHEAFCDCEESLQTVKPEPVKSVTFFSESGPANECCGYDAHTRYWYSIPKKKLSRPPSYTEINKYHIDPLELEKRLNTILVDMESSSDDSSSIEGDDADSETESKPWSRVTMFSE